MDRQLTSTIPEHSYDVQHSETAVHVAKQTLKRRAAEADHPTKYLVAESVSGMSFETRTKIGCKISSLKRMAQRSRQAAGRHPCNPRDLESLVLPPSSLLANSGEQLLLWDSGWNPQTRRSLLFGTTFTTSSLHDAKYLILDGTFKAAPTLFTQLFTIHGLYPDNCSVQTAWRYLKPLLPADLLDVSLYYEMIHFSKSI